MCGRYSLSSPAQLVRETFDVEERAAAPSVLASGPRWNVAPSQEAPVVRLGALAQRHLDPLRWGLVSRGAQTPAGGPINARSETARALPAFAEAFRERRCLVPADGFYEWLELEGRRHPFHIRRRDRRLIAFAGVWGRWQGPRHPPVESFAILTCPPNDVVRPLHDRMPVILPAAAWDAWLTADIDPAALQLLLVPWQGGELEAVPVSPFVNRADHEGEECVRQVAPPSARQLSLLPPP